MKGHYTIKVIMVLKILFISKGRNLSKRLRSLFQRVCGLKNTLNSE